MRTNCGILEKDLADLEGWTYKCTELQLKVTNIENNENWNALELWLERENSGKIMNKDWYSS